jgi:hypothetical protein
VAQADPAELISRIPYKTLGRDPATGQTAVVAGYDAPPTSG